MKKPRLRPRNPLVALAHARGGAGAHEQTTKARRRQDKMALQRELRDTRGDGGGRGRGDSAGGMRDMKWHRQGGADATPFLCRLSRAAALART